MDEQGITLGVTDIPGREDKFSTYLEWLHRADPALRIVRLSQETRNARAVSEVDGLVLTGGGDVDPDLYGKPELRMSARGVDRRRDDFELETIEMALEAEIPILGICRGMQVMNVCLGGTLIHDLPSEGYEAHTNTDGQTQEHLIRPLPHSMLHALLGSGEVIVNSSHHQAVDDLGRGLMGSARSGDGVIEAAEWAMKEGMPYLLLVQWHPERMKDFKHPGSGNVVYSFLREVSRHASLRTRSSFS